MTKNWAIFPKASENIIDSSAHMQYLKGALGGYGVLTGCAVSRASDSSVTAASGTYTNNGVKTTFAGDTLSSITAAAAGKHRYDLVYIDGADDTLKLAAGTEETPTDVNDFLENKLPLPASVSDTDWIVLAVIRVTDAGITDAEFGTYATNSVADMRMSFAFGVDDSTLQVDSNGIVSVKTSATQKSVWSNFLIDGGGSVIETGIRGYITVPACTILAVRLLADQTGSIVVDLWKDTLGNYAPTDADSICAAAVPTLSSAITMEDTTLTGWTTSCSDGDIIFFNVDSCTTITKCTVALKIRI